MYTILKKLDLTPSATGQVNPPLRVGASGGKAVSFLRVHDVYVPGLSPGGGAQIEGRCSSFK